MLSAALVCPTAADAGSGPAVAASTSAAAGARTTGIRAPLPGFVHRQDYAEAFSHLAQAGGPASARRLLSYLEAELTGGEHVALRLALWRILQALSPAQQHTLGEALDGRYRPLLKALLRPWGDPIQLLQLVEHGAAGQRARIVAALLEHHRLDPLDDTAALPPALLLHALQALLDEGAARADDALVAPIQAVLMRAASADAALLPRGVALLFELALQAGDEATATDAMAESIHLGHGALLSTAGVRTWLEGDERAGTAGPVRPLQLAATWEARWLRPAQWGDPQRLQALHDALHRAAPRARLQRLQARLRALGSAGAPTTSTTPTTPTPSAAPSPEPAPASHPLQEALQALGALDQAWLLIDGGGDAVPAMRPMLAPDVLAARTLAALWRSSADARARQRDAEGELIALSQARRWQADDALRQRLVERLRAIGAVDVPTLGSDWRDELPFWRATRDHADPALQRVAGLQLATLWSEGQLQPRSPRREQRLAAAPAAWQELAGHAAYVDLARAALRDPLLRLAPGALQHAHGEDFLWFENPGAQSVLVVFSCISTHHSFAEVATLHARMPGRHLMFIRCPDKNWYSDACFERVHALLAERVARRFAPTEVTCWYGSMGGHAALEFALAFGWRAIVFNPQTDLALWAAYRLGERDLLWGAGRHARLGAAPPAAWARCAVYYACGTHVADREALSVVIERWRRCRRLDLIVEKYDDPHHAGLMRRIAAGPMPSTLAHIDARLRRMARDEAPAAGPAPLQGAAAEDFWDRLDAARHGKLEVQVRDGALWVRPSRLTNTRPG